MPLNEPLLERPRSHLFIDVLVDIVLFITSSYFYKHIKHSDPNLVTEKCDVSLEKKCWSGS